MWNRILLMLLILVATGCGEYSLPGGYSVVQSPMNREWLRDPTGRIVAPGLIKSLHTRGDRILLVAHAASAGGRPLPPLPIDASCFVALSIDTASGETTQITLVEAHRLASRMRNVVSTDRHCH